MRYSYELNWNVYNSIKKQAHIHQHPRKSNNILLDIKLENQQRMYDKHGPNILKHSNGNYKWTPDAKLVLINQYLTGKSMTSVAIDAGIDKGLLYSWIRKYEELGYNGLVESKKGRKCKNPDMNKKTIVQRDLNETELEELIRLRAENEYIKAEIEVLKKSIALRKEKEAAHLKAKKQRSSKERKSKDTN